MRVQFVVEVELERVSGKFASKDEIAENLLAELEGMNPGSVDGVGADGESEYEITDWEVSEK